MTKVVVKVSMNDRNHKSSLFPNRRGQDSRSKALQIAADVPGFHSLSLKGSNRDVIEVTADGVDPVKLASKLRKSVGYANLEAVSDVKEVKKPTEQPIVPLYPANVLLEPQPGVLIVPSQPYVAMEPQPACCALM